MFKRFKMGMKIGFEGFQFLFKYPKTFISIAVFWISIGFIILVVYLLSLLSLYEIEVLQSMSFLLIIVLIVISYSLSISLASLVFLELIEQHETTQTMSIKKALVDTVKRDLLKTLPLIIIWSGVIFVIRVIQFGVGLIAYGIRTVFRLGGDLEFNEGSSLFDLLLKGVRVFIFFTLPAIAFENLRTFKAIRKSMKVIRKTWVEIVGALTFSKILSLIAVIPLVLVYFLYRNETIAFSEVTLIVLVLFISFCFFAFSTLIQQLYAAEIYIWYMTWEREVKDSLDHGEHTPEFDVIDRPSLIDDTPDLINKYKNKSTQ